MRKKRGARLREQLYKESAQMTDLLMLALGLGFFVIALAYVTACDQL